VANPWVVAYDPNDGVEIWRAKCSGGDTAPSPIYAGGLILAVEPYAHLVAIKPDGRGDVTETHVAWKMTESGPDICSPVGNDRYVYLLDGSGALLCCNVANGTKVFDHDLRENFMASPSIVADKLYLLSEEGLMIIAQIGPQFQEIGRCELGEKTHASPAFVKDRVYIRGMTNLYCIGRNP
jgi:outer membrane protein assembly factor BamB